MNQTFVMLSEIRETFKTAETANALNLAADFLLEMESIGQRAPDLLGVKDGEYVEMIWHETDEDFVLTREDVVRIYDFRHVDFTVKNNGLISFYISEDFNYFVKLMGEMIVKDSHLEESSAIVLN